MTCMQEIELSTEPELGRAQEIINNLRKRKLYRHALGYSYYLPCSRLMWTMCVCPACALLRFVDEYILPAEVVAGLRGKEVSAEDISCHNTSNVDIRPDDIIVHNMKINYGSKVP